MRHAAQQVDLDEADRAIINALQGGFPICERPFDAAAAPLGLTGTELQQRIQTLLDKGALSRFGPLYNAERLGGGLTLAAMRVPEDEFDDVARTVNGFAEVAHNYARDHEFNMWFVLATETPERIDEVIDEISAATGYAVFNMPKGEEFFIGLRFEI